MDALILLHGCITGYRLTDVYRERCVACAMMMDVMIGVVLVGVVKVLWYCFGTKVQACIDAICELYTVLVEGEDPPVLLCNAAMYSPPSSREEVC